MNNLRGLWRGKRVDNGEWVKGYLIKMWGKYHLQDQENENLVVEVDPETLGECTGLTDKNGTKIFEGDILRCASENCDDTYTTEVWAFGNTLCVDVMWQNYDIAARDFARELWDKDEYEIEVVGNVYDNPELLKGR